MYDTSISFMWVIDWINWRSVICCALFCSAGLCQGVSRHFIQGMRRKRRGPSSTFKVDMGFSDQSLLELTVFVRESPKKKLVQSGTMIHSILVGARNVKLHDLLCFGRTQGISMYLYN